ncbi:MAG: hypothetical protein ABJA66_11100 [Actinomycetota bacterium]
MASTTDIILWIWFALTAVSALYVALDLVTRTQTHRYTDYDCAARRRLLAGSALRRSFNAGGRDESRNADANEYADGKYETLMNGS